MYRWIALTVSVLLALVAVVIWRSGSADADTGGILPQAPAAPMPTAGEAAMLEAPAPQVRAGPVLIEDDLLLAPSAKAPSPRTAEQKRLARYDKDNDRQVSQAEFLVYSRAAFNRRDLNGDGRLDFAEYAAKRIDAFGAADGDGSGELDAREFATTRTKSSTPSKSCPEPAQAESEA